LFDEWNWCDANTCQEGEAAFVELDIEVKETDSNESEVEAVEDGEEDSYAISESVTLELTNGFSVAGENIADEANGNFYEMPLGYPKITTNNGKTLFTFRFPRTKMDEADVEQIIYDPVLRFMSSSSFAKVGVTAALAMLGSVAFLFA
jgi:hypothetical protein